MRLHLAVVLFASGGVLAFFYSTALWWTVRRLPAAKRPVLLVLASYWVRLALLAAGFYLLMDSDWGRLAVSFGGFLITRTLLVRRARAGAAPASGGGG